MSLKDINHPQFAKHSMVPSTYWMALLLNMNFVFRDQLMKHMQVDHLGTLSARFLSNLRSYTNFINHPEKAAAIFRQRCHLLALVKYIMHHCHVQCL